LRIPLLREAIRVSKRNKFIVIIGSLILLLLLGCGFKSFNRFTERDIPLLIRTYQNFQGTPDGHFAARQLLRLCKIPEGLSAVVILEDAKDGRVATGAGHVLWDIVGNWFYRPENLDEAIELMTVLRAHEDERVRKYAYTTLFDLTGRIHQRSPEEAYAHVASLVPGLADPSPLVTERVIRFLPNRYDDDWEYPVDEMKELFNDADLRTRLNAAMALAQITPEYLEPMELIIENLETDDYELQKQLIRSLRFFGEEANVAFPTLLKIIENDPRLTEGEFVHDYNAGHAAYMFHFIGAPDISVLNRLTELMYGGPTSRRRTAVEALGNLKIYGIPALPALKEKLEDPFESEEGILYSTASAIGSIYRYSEREEADLDEQAEVDYLISLLDSDEPYKQMLAAEGLAIFAESAEKALPKLRSMIAEPVPDVLYNQPETHDEFLLDSLKSTAYQIEYWVGVRNDPSYSLLPHAMNGY